MFFKLTANGWTELYAQLTKSELGLLYYIRSLDPFGDRELELSNSLIAKKLRISVRTVQRALASLKAKGLIVANYVRTCVGGSKMSPSDDIVQAPHGGQPECIQASVAVMEATRIDTQATQSDINATQNVVEATPMSHSRSEIPTQQAIQKPETNKTKYKKKDSLSDKIQQLPEEERENFLSFAFKEIGKLPNPPVFPEDLIFCKFDSLYSDFLKSSAPETQKATEDKQFSEWCDLMKAVGKLTRVFKNKRNGEWVLLDICGREIDYEDYRETYTLEYLRKCVKGK